MKKRSASRIVGNNVVKSQCVLCLEKEWEECKCMNQKYKREEGIEKEVSVFSLCASKLNYAYF